MSKEIENFSVDFAREAIVALSAHVRDYCITGRERVATAHRNHRAGEAVRYVENAVRLTREMDKLLGMASGIGKMEGLDYEGMRGEVEFMKDLVEGVAVRELWIQN